MISIIIPVYNAEKYIKRTINSILNQTEQDFEIIAIDDGSTDKSYQIIKELSKHNKRIKVYTKENGGVSDARNYGIEHSTGEYLMFVDADDMLVSDGLEKLYSTAQKYNADITIGNSRVVKLNGKIKETPKEFHIYHQNRKEVLTDFLRGKSNYDCYSVCAKLFKKSICQDIRFEKSKSANEDRYYFFLTICKATNIMIINEDVYIYEKHENSLSTARADDRLFSCVYFAELMCKYVKNHESWANELTKYNLLITDLLVYRNFYRDKERINIFLPKLEKLRKEIIDLYNERSAKISYTKKLEVFVINHMNGIYYYFIKLIDMVRR